MRKKNAPSHSLVNQGLLCDGCFLPLCSLLELLWPVPDLVLVQKDFKFGKKMESNYCARIQKKKYLRHTLFIIIILYNILYFLL